MVRCVDFVLRQNLVLFFHPQNAEDSADYTVFCFNLNEVNEYKISIILKAPSLL